MVPKELTSIKTCRKIDKQHPHPSCELSTDTSVGKWQSVLMWHRHTPFSRSASASTPKLSRERQRGSLTRDDVECQHIIRREVLVNPPVHLTELRQPRCSHPYNEVLVKHTLDRTHDIRVNLVQEVRLQRERQGFQGSKGRGGFSGTSIHHPRKDTLTSCTTPTCPLRTTHISPPPSTPPNRM